MEKQKKQLAVLLLILIAACVVFGLLSSSSKKESETVSEEESFVVNDIEADQATKLIFTNSIGTFSLRKDAEEWVLEEDKTADIDEAQVTKLLETVAPLHSSDRIEEVEDLKLYGLDTPVRTIMVSDGEKNSTILVGDFNELTNTYYICLEEDTSTIYTTDYNTVNTFEVQEEDLIITQVEEETTEETSE